MECPKCKTEMGCTYQFGVEVKDPKSCQKKYANVVMHICFNCSETVIEKY